MAKVKETISNGLTLITWQKENLAAGGGSSRATTQGRQISCEGRDAKRGGA